MTMTTQTRVAADAALDAVLAHRHDRRAAEAAQWGHIAAFARVYRVDEVTETHMPILIGALRESLSIIGGEGTPQVSEYAALELGAALTISEITATRMMAASLDLHHRLPRTWHLIETCTIETWVGRDLAERTRHLPKATAGWVDARFAARAAGLPFSRQLRLIRALVAEADPEREELDAQARRESRYVKLSGHDDGSAFLEGRLDLLDGHLFDAAVDRIADLLAAGSHPDHREPKSLLRAKAIGVLARPAAALALLQSAAQPELFPTDEPPHPDPTDLSSPDDTEGASADDAAGRAQHTDTSDSAFSLSASTSATCLGVLCGRVVVPPAALLPAVTLVIHVTEQTARCLTGPARVEGWGDHPLETLIDHLGREARVTIRPVLDLNQTPGIDRYEIPALMRETVANAHLFEVFPGSTTPITRCDLDHITPYTARAGASPPQTRVANLAPLSRRVHRAKTARHWTLDAEPTDGQAFNTSPTLRWRSPLGRSYRIGPAGVITDE